MRQINEGEEVGKAQTYHSVKNHDHKSPNRVQFCVRYVEPFQGCRARSRSSYYN
jgi:hypothetical protein